MASPLDMIGYTGHALAAALFATLAILTSRRVHDRSPARQVLIVALSLSALWSLEQALGGVLGAGSMGGVGMGGALTETLRNGAWLVYICVAARLPGTTSRASVVRRFLVLVLGGVLLLQLVLDVLIGGGATLDTFTLPLFGLSWLFRCLFALGTLTLLHDLFSRPAQGGRSRINSWVAAALTFMWAYDCNHYALALLWKGEIAAVGPMRGFAMALLAPVIAIGLQAGRGNHISLSRTAIQRIVGGIVLALYMLVVLLLVTLASGTQGQIARLVPISLLFVLSVGALAILPSASLRSWFRVEIAKHIFAHRYDYRVEWRRFTQAVSENHADPRPLGERVARGVAQIVGSPAALTLLRDAEGRLVPDEGWEWTGAAPVIPAELSGKIETSEWIIDLGARDTLLLNELPEDIRADASLWALVPAIHNDRLVGAVLLARPARARRMDWEDLDIMRVVGGQAAATISDALRREALVDAQRFEEFNRRFAFILHDIKNQVSQMSLLASNAERHADNPVFRADMVTALKEMATRMTGMLQKLTKPASGAGAAGGVVQLLSLLRATSGEWSRNGTAVTMHAEGAQDLAVNGDVEALHRALGQIVQNAIEASGEGGAVSIRLRQENGQACIDIVDTGTGMSADFIRTSLFRPFASSKPGGFGLGAQEAKTLIEAMGGRLDVVSEPGRGTAFTARFPIAMPADLVAPPGQPPAMRRHA